MITDELPQKKQRKLVEKPIKKIMAQLLPEDMQYEIHHHASKSCMALQVCDYCNWAIYRKWRDSDERSYRNIQPAIRSEFDIFRSGNTFYY